MKCHSVAIRVVRNKWCITEIVLVGDRGPRSRNWCTNSSEENRIGASPATRWRRLCKRVAVFLSIDQGELLRRHSGVEQVVERDEEATTSPEGLSYPKSKLLGRKEVDSEERHSAVEADLPIAKEGMQMQGNG
ncbi:hypothetical protein B296_00037494 [Ensete ventricosum]|uniref:Uncharacterized protein n=1 Tax=Ensete ventricosum TaxID=4639 RepID=A0A426Y7X0_ENSVE|nr:hypothetical protein B296_00037494 [Ensete ventricosum]